METEIGTPKMLGEAVGRIIGFSDKGTMATINGLEGCSILIWSTPHGSEIETGRFYLNDITPEGLEKLNGYESELKKENKPLYNNKIKV